MAEKIKTQAMTEQAYDVWQGALQRIDKSYDMFDNLIVMFSGGKDSTAALQATIEVARKRNRLPVEAWFFDEEAIPYETVEYVERLRHNPDVDLKWYCLPMKSRNACSTKFPDWYPFHPDQEDLWVRPLPDCAITDDKDFRFGMEIITFCEKKLAKRPESTAQVLGIRMQESLTRYQAISKKADVELCFLSKTPAKNVAKVYPVYDWRVEDIWHAPLQHGWDYNKAYDVMEKAGLTINQQRCSPAFGEQPIRGLWRFATCWPDMWEKMINRVDGAATAARYANTELYLSNGESGGISYKLRVELGLERLPDDACEEVKHAISLAINRHKVFTSDPIPDDKPHPETGISWRILYRAVLAGGDKFGRQSQKLAKMIRQHRITKENNEKTAD